MMKTVNVKNGFVVSLLFSLAMLVGCVCPCEEAQPDFPDLNGVWIGRDYQCPFGTYQNEQVRIQQNSNQIRAVKITGDPCVTAGNVTFTGTYNTATQQYDLTWTVGNPSNPNSATTSGYLKIVNKNKLEGYSNSSEFITFTR